MCSSPLRQILLVADDADVRLHLVLQVFVNEKRVRPLGALERRQRFARGLLDLAVVERRERVRASRTSRRAAPAMRPKTRRSRERVAAEAVRAVHPRRALAGGEEPA